jgi:NAD(P)H-quinone oxidoreductase subunit 5
MESFLYDYAWLIPLFPLLAALFIGIGLISFRNATQSLRRDLGFVSLFFVGLSVLFSFALLFSQIQGASPYEWEFEWLHMNNFVLELGYLVDPLSSLLLVVVSTVAFLVLIYTDGYMSMDEGYLRFFGYLSLFTSSMLGLVLSPNLIQIYIFWELIGVCSYLLIGFWFTRATAGEACQKAFVTNRIGDFGLMLGILGFYWLTKSFHFDEIAIRIETLCIEQPELILWGTLFAFFVFLGPVSKSAQFPLHVWLPDAMEGPTPISALIHAATLVAAGVFLVGRMFPIFSQFPILMNIIAWTGGLTAFLGASIATTQVDLKKGLAYSTVSQLGYMMMAMGVGSYSAGVFHLITHAYSKALLFLGSGSVIHGMEGAIGLSPFQNQNMNNMGGLRKKMPITAITFLIGTLSICGFPPFACFWSKDAILSILFETNPILGFIAWGTAGLTSFYMFRIYFLTFEGTYRGPDFSRVKESSFMMVFPLMVLTIPTLTLGLTGTPFNNVFQEFLEGGLPEETESWVSFLSMAGSSVFVGTLGFFLSFRTYFKGEISRSQLADQNQPLYQFSFNKWYIDEAYQVLFVEGNRKLAKSILYFDHYFVVGVVYLRGVSVFFTGESLRYTETGRVQFYGSTILVGFLSFLLFLNFQVSLF